ncbi:xenobiotic-transporting ATPase [Lewinellaceae bacterium SD302]|nr:xenobiotic-transporting ATPase [Lewinellaceae bacterium SD302]
MTKLSATQRFFKMLELDKREISYIYLYAIFSGLITLSLPLGIQAIIGLIVGGSVSAALVVLVSVVTIGTMLTGILKVMQLTVTENIQRRLFARSSFEFAWRLPRIRYEKLLGDYPPELVNRFFDTLTLQKGLPKLLTDISTAALQIVFGLLLISLYHATFVVFSVSLIFILIALFYFTGPRGLSTSMLESKYKYKVAHWLEEIGRAVTTFKLSGQAKLPLDKTKGLVAGYLSARRSHFRILLLQYGAMVVFKTLVTLALLSLGALLVIENSITIGQFVAAEIVIILILSSIEKLILSMDVIYDMLTAVEKIGYVTDLPMEDEAAGLCFNEVKKGNHGMALEFRQLNFRFPDSERKVIDELTLSIKAGEKICILGPNRSGKSTLIQLAGLLYTEYEGSISYNGIPARNLDYQDLRRHIGDYMRDEDIFRATLLQNLWLHDDSPDLRQIQEVIETFGLTEYVAGLPDGYDTELLPSGRNLPASVRTKLLLARTLMGNPALLALGDFGANLNAADRRRIAEVLTRIDDHTTVLAVSDDPYFASRCDRIIYLENGKVALDGTYAQLAQDPRVAYTLGLSSADPYNSIN